MELQTPTFPDALVLPQQARTIVIRDQETYTAAANFKLDLSAWRKRIVEEFAPMKEAAHRAHKTITAKENEYLAPITEAEEVVKLCIRSWQDQQERIRQAEQRRLEAEARVRAEEDRKRREAEAAIIRAEEIRRAEEAKAKDEALRLEAALEAERTGGNVDAALNTPAICVPEVLPVEAYMEPATPIYTSVAAPTYDAVKGLGIPRTWKAEVIAIRRLCAAVANGEVPESYVSANMPALNSRARADKNMMNIPGVRAVQS